ncbi:MAG TPA: FAD-dependent monooxygenase [Pseudolabrys sp.]|nr:FAD-dependent monooxygenase [Pseudolabrys sp.]
MADMQELTTEVLIVGGGPVGLALANELGMRGVRALLVEQHDRVGSQPRAKTTNVRTMEHMRRWGLAEKVRQASALPRGYPTDVFFLTRLYGHELAHFKNAFNGYSDRDERYSEHAQWIPQYVIESVLRDGVALRPSVDVRFGVRLDSLAQSETGVTAELTSLGDGATFKVKASYLVGADGARSTVRELIGAKLEGQHGLGSHYNTIIRVPEFGANPPRQRGIMYWLVNPESPAVMTPMDTDNTWTFGTTLKGDKNDLSPEEIRDRLYKSVGRPVDFDIVAVDRWSGHRLIADRYRDRRVFLAGDACHLHPPFGGFGMNMGIGDAVDLGWKLTAVLNGWGGSALLESYQSERRPVHLRVLEVSVQNYSVLSEHLVRDRIDSDDELGRKVRAELTAEIVKSKAQEFRSLGVVLGSHYSGSPIVIGDGTPPPPARVMEFEPSAHPGCLAPHMWLDESTSLYDRFDKGFTVLVTDPSAEAAGRRLLEAGKADGLPVSLLMPNMARLRELYGCSLALIRPDQHVAWRGDAVPEDPPAVVRRVCGFGAIREAAETAA